MKEVALSDFVELTFKPSNNLDRHAGWEELKIRQQWFLGKPTGGWVFYSAILRKASKSKTPHPLGFFESAWPVILIQQPI